MNFGEPYTQADLINQELFWNRIMMEHARFIQGILDPAECELIETANGFEKDYCRLLVEAKEQGIVYSPFNIMTV